MHYRIALLPISVTLFGALSLISSESHQLRAMPSQVGHQQRPQEGLITWVKTLISEKIPTHRAQSARAQSVQAPSILWVSKTEVTVKQYQACVKAGWCKAPQRRNLPKECNIFSKDRQTHPMNCVTYEEARRFASWFGTDVDLLTHSEWDAIARLGQERELTIKPPPPGNGVYQTVDTQPVDTHVVSASGVSGMDESLWEWTRAASQPHISSHPSTHPSSDQRIQRCVQCSAGRLSVGGSWIYTRSLVAMKYRCGDGPELSYPDIPSVNIGFRIRKWSSPL